MGRLAMRLSAWMPRWLSGSVRLSAGWPVMRRAVGWVTGGEVDSLVDCDYLMLTLSAWMVGCWRDCQFDWVWLVDGDGVCSHDWLVVRLSTWMVRSVLRLSARMADWW